MADNVIHDSPTDLLHNIANQSGECAAQSVVPNADGEYIVACSCQHWETTASSREEGLRLAREHTSRSG